MKQFDSRCFMFAESMTFHHYHCNSINNEPTTMARLYLKGEKRKHFDSFQKHSNEAK